MPIDALLLPVISSSLDADSRSRALALRAAESLRSAGHEAVFVDLAEANLPAFDNRAAFVSARFQEIHELIRTADGVVLASPVYNWGLGSNLKNLIESTGATGDGQRTAAWFDKVVTFICAGGLPHSYMGYTALASSMMLDFKCVINPYAVYSTDRDWEAPDAPSGQLLDRLKKTLTVHTELATLLKDRMYSSGWEI
ncbi:NADPH-dependent oxidoreductase [Arthrobacter crusticola]|uniref:NADPH-dependent oxidoreductase n=1 Tax=Arthrobacter crusticola TaxID=2547960 RepID=A0A4R5TMN3_9MICC|nr:NAD(P)H-dependent oxidoreductase [Arthrobacter crusticola]TDK23925.1 NADPH-dependent oxidoreductase [Arthrobacter crusticola]